MTTLAFFGLTEAIPLKHNNKLYTFHVGVNSRQIDFVEDHLGERIVLTSDLRDELQDRVRLPKPCIHGTVGACALCVAGSRKAVR